MAFWDLEEHPASSVALMNGSQEITYGELLALSGVATSLLPKRRSFGFLAMPNEVAAIAFYLGALRDGRHVPLLIQPDMDASMRDALVAHYKPDWAALLASRTPPPGYSRVTGPRAFESMAVYVRKGGNDEACLHEQLALLLNTSGSTGSSKLVRHSGKSIAANAKSIALYLDLTKDDVAITTLPLAYSFGMSILNSHLQVGAKLILNDHALVTREFWDLARCRGITSVSGVPATYEMLYRLDLERQGLTALRTLTQAGGRLRDGLVRHFDKLSRRLGMSFFVMYGQTEAAPRISYVPPEHLAGKIGSIGVPIPGGRLEVDAATNELLYRGPNVMLGYAERREDLNLGDVEHGLLHTGDLAHSDADGFYYLTGRTKRFVKIAGVRINLDQVEAMLSECFDELFACSGGDDNLVAFTTTTVPTRPAAMKQLIIQRYKLFHGHVHIVVLAALPLLESGKVDYRSLATLTQETAQR